MDEQDKYSIDTSGAVKGMDEVTEATNKSKHAHEGLSDFITKDLKEAFFTAEAQYELLKKGMEALNEAIQEGAKDYLDNLQASTRLDLALKNVGNSSIALRARLKEQADAIEKLTGADDTATTSLQAMLASMGVAPEQIERFTDASYRLANMMGTDATQAARLLAKAHGEGKEELKRFGITVADVETNTGDFNDVLTAVEKNFVSLNASVPEQVKALNELKKEWKEIKETVGGVAVEGLLAWRKGFGMQVDQIREFLGLAAKVKEEAKALEETGAGAQRRTLPAFDVTKEAKEQEEARKKAFNAWKENRLGEIERLEKAQQFEQKKEDTQGAVIVALKDKWHKAQDAQDKQFDAQKVTDEETAFEQHRQRADAAAAMDQVRWKSQFEFKQKLDEDELNFAKSSGMALVNLGAGFLKEELLSHTQYTKAYHDQIIQQMTIGKSKAEADKIVHDYETKTAAEAEAALAEKTAAVLADIAVQAGIKAGLYGAEAIALLVSHQDTEAGQAGVAAAMFAAVAVAAGGTAAVLSSNRGMTSAEHASLESNSKAFDERQKREAAQESQRGGNGGVGTQVSIIHMGITGQTEIEQGRELERIRKQYDASKTGGN